MKYVLNFAFKFVHIIFTYTGYQFYVHCENSSPYFTADVAYDIPQHTDQIHIFTISLSLSVCCSSKGKICVISLHFTSDFFWV